jgi:hypothetical protein
MSKYIVLSVIVFCLLFIATPSRSDVAPPTSPVPGGGGGNGTGPNAHGHRGGQGLQSSTPTLVHPAFTPYDPGPPEAIWSYSKLTSDEKAVVDSGMDTSQWDAVHAAFGSAVVEQAKQATVQAAASQLGVSYLGRQGVVP